MIVGVSGEVGWTKVRRRRAAALRGIQWH
jgi:hypothetical protein